MTDRLTPRFAIACLAASALCGHAAASSNLVLVSIDTLRADFIGTYGYPDRITPNIDALGERGAVFEDTLSVIGKTGPSFASIFSSLYPPTHGARRNGVRMRDDVPVLAEILGADGYRSAAFISNWTLKSRLAGVDRGFDHFDESFNKERNSFGLMERDARDVTVDALSWLADREGTEPLFLWVHYSEPHSPYELQSGHIPPEPDPELRPSGWRKRVRYASEVAFTDTWIGKLLSGIEEKLGHDTLFVVLSDHGESLGEHSYWGHGKNTHWPNLRVPWIVAGPGIPTGIRVPKPVSLIDVLPTVLDLLAIDPPKGLVGTSRIANWATDGPSAQPRFAVGERGNAITKKGKTSYNHPVTISAQTEDLKAIFDFSSRRMRYYDLRTDALEESPLDASPIDMRPPLGRQLEQWYRELPKYEQRRGELTSEDLRQLKNLGYL
ncbi:MAG: sulfatase [Acidobacteriota bacterium]|nr:sulfatase [Acidobacteriota bacterium]